MEEEQLPALFDNLKQCFGKLDDETIWTIMTMYPMNGDWDAAVINKLLELSGEEVNETDIVHSFPRREMEGGAEEAAEDTDDSDYVYPDTALPMKNEGHHTDQNNLKKRNVDKRGLDWDEFDKDFNFDYKKKDNGINFARFSDTLSNMWNNVGGSSSDSKDQGYEMSLLDNNKKRK